MSIRAKFTITSVLHSTDGAGNKTQEQITASAVMTRSDESEVNKQWSKWTPYGELKLHISNPGAFDRMRPGQYFFVDLTPCEKDSI